MIHKMLFPGVKDIIIDPVKSWETIYSEKQSVKAIRNNIVFPLIMLGAVSAITGSLFFTHTEFSIAYSVIAGIKYFCLMLFTIYATSLIFREITYPLDLGRNFNVAFKIITYSITPFLICQVLSLIFESLLFVNIIGLYGLYIFWTGTEKLLTPQQHRRMPMLIATSVSLAVIYVATDMILTILTDKLYYAFLA